MMKATVGMSRDSVKLLSREALEMQGKWKPNFPIMLIPGFGSSALNVHKGPDWVSDSHFRPLTFQKRKVREFGCQSRNSPPENSELPHNDLSEI